MAIITRWFMPPESWCGKARSRRSGIGDADRSAAARSSGRRRSLRSRPRCSFSASPIWKPTVKHGLRLDIGSWKIIAMSLPTILRRWRAKGRGDPVRRRRGAGAETVAVHGSRPMTASMATDLPEPDSPTIACTSPASTVSDTPSTARKAPCAVAKSTDSPLISRSGIVGWSVSQPMWSSNSLHDDVPSIDRLVEVLDVDAALEIDRHRQPRILFVVAIGTCPRPCSSSRSRRPWRA